MSKELNVSLVVGARPNFIKVAPLVRQLENSDFKVKLIHTGQHWDEKLSNEIFQDLKLREPDIHLDTPKDSMNKQLGYMIQKFDDYFSSNLEETLVGVVGDVTSTLAASLSAKNKGRNLFHIEAGLRSKNLLMPEERNRIMVDHISDICFAPCNYAVANLTNENIDKQKISLVGNIMIDSLKDNIETIKSAYSEISSNLGISKDFFVVTLHRDENLEKEILEDIFSALINFSKDFDIVLPAHPRLKNFIEENSIDTGGIKLTQSLPYISFLSLVLNSKICLTDSGGLQEETSVLGVPCLTLRKETERPITVEEGTNKVIGTKKSDIIESVKLVLETGEHKEADIPLWDGQTSMRIVEVLKERFI